MYTTSDDADQSKNGDRIIENETNDDISVTSALIKSLGGLLREARAGRFTIDELAKRSNVSAGRISQIERGLANPSFETLWRIASALEVPIGSLFSDGGPEEQLVVRKDARRRLVIPKDGLVYELLTPNVQGALEILLLEIPPGYDGGSRPPLKHRGEKFLHVRSGELVVQVSDRKWRLNAGDSITFNAIEPHFVCNDGTDPALIELVVTPPSF